MSKDIEDRIGDYELLTVADRNIMRLEASILGNISWTYFFINFVLVYIGFVSGFCFSIPFFERFSKSLEILTKNFTG